MKNIALALALASPLALAAPCESGSYEVGPYVGLGAQASKLHLKHGLRSHQSIQPYIFGGLKVAPNLAVEFGGSLKAHKNKPQSVTRTQSSGPLSITYVEQLPVTRSRKIDARFIGNWPLTWGEDIQGIVGLGVSHLKLKQSKEGYPSLAHQRLVPSALVGLEVGTLTPLRFRVSAAYAHGLNTGVPGVRAKHNLSALAGLVWAL